MPNSLGLLVQQLKEIWKHFGLAQKASTLIALAAVAAAIVGMLIWSSRPQYQVLYANLSLQDASDIREKLNDEKVEYRLLDSGRTILVSSKDVYNTRLTLASEGLPRDGATGFELFEQPKFGLTDFAQQVNYQRALQGELERTIRAMRGIEGARVMLVLPKDRLFATAEEKRASASILLTLAGGVSLNAGQIQSITQLVGGSVPGLTAGSVTITDQYGHLLSQPSGPQDDPVGRASDQLAATEKLERMLTQKAQEMLDRALGPGRSIVRVSAAMDFSQVERRNETYDPEGRVVRSEAIMTESSSGPAPHLGGVAGVVANVPVGAPGSGTVERELNKSKKENIRTEYAIPNGVEMVVEKGARLSRLSVSVCVARGEEERTPAQMDTIKQMVSSCVGLVQTPRRQDAIEVTEMLFADLDAPLHTPWWQSLPFSLDALGRGLLATALVLLVFFMSRKVIAGLVVRREDVGVPVQHLQEEYAGVGPAERRARLGGEAGESLSEEELTDLELVERLAQQNPRTIAAWITGAVAGNE